MAAAAIHVAPDDSFDDWVIQEDDGRELGHFPTRESAELVAQALQVEAGRRSLRTPDPPSRYWVRMEVM